MRDAVQGWVSVVRQGSDRAGNALVLVDGKVSRMLFFVYLLLLTRMDAQRAKVPPGELLQGTDLPANFANVLDLPSFNEGSVFVSLVERFREGLLYTYCGHSLVAMNPNSRMDELYLPGVRALYRGLPTWQTRKLQPHLYGMAQHAYSELIGSESAEPQTIVLTGRVGSGKTESAKHLLRFLAELDATPASVGERPSSLLEMCHVLLESFSNAVTRDNYNSSRSGLLTQVFFSPAGLLKGVNFVPYLFERTRLTTVTPGDRNFHIFYQLILGATPEERKTYVLLAANKYRYLRMGGVVDVEGVDDAKDLGALRQAFKGLHFSQSSQNVIFRILSAVLHLGNVGFVYHEDSDSVSIKSAKVVNIVAALVGCDENVLVQSMCEAIPPPTLDDEEPPPPTQAAEDMRDLIAQTIFARLFDWVVGQVNLQLQASSPGEMTHCISILDQFGFEDCDVNGLHRLSINYQAERFYSDLIEARNQEEQEMYMEEGVPWEPLDLGDGAATECLDVFDALEEGVWDVITEESQNPNAVDADVIGRLASSFSGSPILRTCGNRYDMIIKHSSGDVCYNVQRLPVDNLEGLPDALWACLEGSSSSIVKKMFDSRERDDSSLLSVRCLGDVDYVLSLVMPTRLHFVHCITPNTQADPQLVDGNAIVLQMLGAGLMSTGLLRQKGFVFNFSYAETIHRFGFLVSPRPRFKRVFSDKDCTRLLKALLSDLKESDAITFFVGTSRVFLSHAAVRVLEGKRSERMKAAAGSIASVFLRLRFLRKLSKAVSGSSGNAAGPTGSRRGPSAPSSPRRGLPVLPRTTNESPVMDRRSGAEAAVDMTRGAIALVRLIYKDPLPRGDIIQKLKEVKALESSFKEFERSSCMQDEVYSEAIDVVCVSLRAFCDAVRSVCRSREDKPMLLSACKSRHNELVLAVRAWKGEYTRVTAALSPRSSSSGVSPSASLSESPPVAGSSGATPTFGRASSQMVMGSSRSSSLRSSSNSAMSPPTSKAPSVPQLKSVNSVTLGSRRPGVASLSPRAMSSMGDVGGSSSSAPRAAAPRSPRMVPGVGSSVGGVSPGASSRTTGGVSPRVVYHDSPKQKRKAQTREMMGKIVSGGGSVKETLDKLDAELALKEFKKDSCLLQFDMPDGTRLKTKVSSKLSASEAKAYVVSKVLAYAPDVFRSLSPNDYILKVFGIPTTILNEAVPLSRISYVQACAYVFIIPVLEMIKQITWDSRKELDLTSEISQELSLHTVISKLIGPSFKSFLEVEDEEFTRLRSAMTHARLLNAEAIRAKSGREGQAFMLHEYVDVEPMPPVVPKKIMISLRLPIGQGMVAMEPSDTVEQVLEKACAKIRRTDPKRKDTPEQYLIKETGRQSFMLDRLPMLRYDYVRNQICAEKPVLLSLVDKESTLNMYSDQKASTSSFMDLVLESWLEDKEMHDETTSDLISRATLSEFARPWKIKLHGVQGLPQKYFTVGMDSGDLAEQMQWHFFLRVAIVQGEQSESVQFTKPCAQGVNLRWDQWIFMCPINQISRGARLAVSLHAIFAFEMPMSIEESLCQQAERVGWVNIPMFNQYGVLVGGSNTLGFQMWVGEETGYDVTCQGNIFSDTWFYASFEDTKKPIVYPPPDRTFKLNFGAPNARGVMAQQEKAKQEQKALSLVDKDWLSQLTGDEKKTLWEARHSLKDSPKALPKVLAATNWSDYLHAQDMYTLMEEWSLLEATQVLQLLSGRFLDPFIRDFAVKQMQRLSDAELLMFMPQLTQALKYEPYHFNALAEVLTERALQNRHRLGHSFFWALKAEMHLPKIAGRYGCLLESYLRGAGTHRRELEMQGQLVDQLVSIAKELKEIKDHEKRLTYLRTHLADLTLPERFQLPLDPRYEVGGLIIDKCKFMDSKKVPLWLVFKNAEESAPNITVIFKEGDDLRQDILTIQMLRLMNQLWKIDGLDLGMSPYGCISCGDEIGLIEVVGNSVTTAGIARDFGGAKAVLQKETMFKWLMQNNEKAEDFQRAQRNFMKSCAAYCVATYVLGIGDRHNDNIMVSREGYFFHIDFGHFLGNFKSKMGIKRETAPFVLTAQYVEVMGGKKSALFREFVNTSCRIFLTLRRHSELFLTLFSMCVGMGIPELTKDSDIYWLRTALHLSLSEQEASKKFEKLIDVALASKMTGINHFVHNLAKR